MTFLLYYLPQLSSTDVTKCKFYSSQRLLVSLILFKYVVFTFPLLSCINTQLKSYPYISFEINLEKIVTRAIASTIHEVQNCIVYPIERARTVSFLRKEKAYAATSDSMTSDRGSMPEQRMTSDWQIVNRCQLNSPQRLQIPVGATMDFADEFDESILRRKFHHRSYVCSNTPFRKAEQFRNFTIPPPMNIQYL